LKTLHVFDNFFNFSVAELKTTTLVSRSWEDFIGQSLTCMKKINLTINGRKYFISNHQYLLKDELKLLSKSCRKYENFTFYAQQPRYLINEVINLLATRKRKWKNMKVWSEMFESVTEIENFLETFAENVENVELRNVKLSSKFSSDKNFVFKKLKNLKLCDIKEIKFFLNFFKTTSNQLEFLEVENNIDDDSLINFLNLHEIISKLHITQIKWDCQLFNKLSSTSSLKLKEFKIKTGTLSLSEQKDFVAFLKVQADNITKLTVDLQLNDNTIAMIFKLPYLSSLHVLTSPSDDFINFHVSTSINELRLNFHSTFEMISKFIDAMPNLKRLELPLGDKKVIELIRCRLPNLEKFKIL
jgi:hypothetical protein